MKHFLTVFLLMLFFSVQPLLWWGEGGWSFIVHQKVRLGELKLKTLEMEKRNSAIVSALRDFEHNPEVIEERIRFQLGYVRPGELYFSYSDTEKD